MDLKEEMLLKHDLRKFKVTILKTSPTHIFHVLIPIRDNRLLHNLNFSLFLFLIATYVKVQEGLYWQYLLAIHSIDYSVE